MALDYPAARRGPGDAGAGRPIPGAAASAGTTGSSTTPVIGPLLAYTITLPLGFLLARARRARRVPAADHAARISSQSTATPLLLRPREFLANARELVTLKAAVAEQAPRYGEIKAPVMVISGDVDKTVSTSIHSRPFAAAVNDRKTDRAAAGRPHDSKRRARSRGIGDRGHDRQARAARRGCRRLGAPDGAQLPLKPDRRVGMAAAGW